MMSIKKISFSFFLLFLGFFLFCPCLAFAGLVDPSLKWKTVKTEHFAINYYEGEEEVVEKLIPIVEDVYREITSTFHAYPKGRTEVVVVDNHDLANGFATIIPYNLIVLRVVPPLADTELADFDEWLRELFLHEYTHIVHITDTGYPAKILKFLFGKLVAPNGLTPGWVTEGMATYFETTRTSRGRGRSSFADMLLRTDILEDRFLKIDQMAGSQYDWPAWRAQYLYGVGFWQFLAERYGEEKMIEFSHHYGSSLRFFMMNSQAKRSFDGKTFYTLWKEWKAELTERYEKVRAKVVSSGLQEGSDYLTPAEGESYSLPTFSANGEHLAYLSTSVHHPPELRLRDIKTGREKILLKDQEVQQMSFSSDGQKLIVSHLGNYKKYNQYSDLYEIDLKTGKKKQLSRGMRARDPDDAPDGSKIVAVLQKTGHAELAVYDRETKQWESVLEASQIDHPRWMPNGQDIVVSLHRDHQRDLWIVNSRTGKAKRITNDVAIEDRPVVDLQKGVVYFSSDKTGIPNIYLYIHGRKKVQAVTNVISGAFAPSLASEDGIFFQYYTGRGFEIRKMSPVGAKLVFAQTRQWHEKKYKDAYGNEGEHEVRPYRAGAVIPSTESAQKYNPFRKLFIPRYIMPNAALIDGSLFLSATVSNFDPLYRHFWFGSVTYRSDNDFVGYGVGYTYSRYLPSFSVGFNDFSVNYGDVFGLGTDFFEERRRAYGAIGFPMGAHYASLQYFFENRSEQSGLPEGATLSTLGNYAGFLLRYDYRNTKSTAAGISPERGEKVTLGIEATNRFFGASEQLEQFVVGGDFRKYILMPYAQHHVIALRAAGGAAFGDQLLQGNFVLGGSLGESLFTGASTRLFTLRGLPLATFSRDRAWIASAEYRMPLFRLQRGLGTIPIALNSMHLAFFTDVGDAFNDPAFRPLLGVGAEIRGDFVIGYHVPIMGRLGYGVILTNRGRIAGVTDSLTGVDARNGVLILEVGTSF